MADSWQTIEQAAVSLRLSVRTVNRHMAAGKLQSRLNADGRREVLVSLPDTAPDASPSPFSDTLATDTPAEVSDNTQPTISTSPPSNSGGSLDPETVLALADSAAQKADMAVTAYQTLARLADTQVRQVRRQARLAWAAVALMAAGVTIAVGWTTHRLTRANADADHLATRLGQLQDQAIDHAQVVRQQSASFETERAAAAAAQSELRAELAAAREQVARAEGSLASYKDQELARQTRETVSPPEPTTRPASAVIADALARFLESTKSDKSDAAGARLASETSAVPALEGKVPTPATRPAALRRKVIAATSRPAAVSDTTSASTHTDD